MIPVFYSSPERFFEILFAAMEDLLPCIRSLIASRFFTPAVDLVTGAPDCPDCPIFSVGSLISSAFGASVLAPPPRRSHRIC